MNKWDLFDIELSRLHDMYQEMSQMCFDRNSGNSGNSNNTKAFGEMSCIRSLIAALYGAIGEHARERGEGEEENSNESNLN